VNGVTPVTGVTTSSRVTFLGGPTSGRTRPEVWAAQSTDGQWAVERLETPGTPWGAIYLPLVELAALLPELEVQFASLPQARRWIGTPAAHADLVGIAHRVVTDGGGIGGMVVFGHSVSAAEREEHRRRDAAHSTIRVAAAHAALAILLTVPQGAPR
jgi:hypothetical protein